MKKSLEILGLPVISITEGRELGLSKSLLIDAKNGTVAAITIEDDSWYRGVKLLPYSSVIAIGNDAVTVISSENILTLEDAGDYESMLDANIKIIGTKAITKSGTIQGNVVEIFVGENGKIEKCEIEASDGSLSEITADQVSIFGKQVTVIDSDLEKKNDIIAEEPEAEAEPEIKEEPEAPAAEEEPEIEEELETEVEEEPEEELEIEEEPEAEEEPEPEPEPAPAPIQTAKNDQAKALADRATEERHRRFLLGKTATRTISMDNGIVIVEAGAAITEEVLQKAKLANKFIELSMNVQ